jgi:hypothetical protein
MRPQKRAVGARRTSDALQLNHIHSRLSTCGWKGRSGILATVDGFFTGARLNELAPLTAADVVTDPATDIVSIISRRTKSVGAVSRPSVRSNILAWI